MDVDGYGIEPLTSERFAALEAVLGRSGIGGCWCMWWALPPSEKWGDAAAGGASAPNKKAMRSMVEAGPPPGLLAYDGDAAVAWCRVVPRSTLPGLLRSRHFKTDLDIAGVWSLPCFFVRRSHRGRGLTTALTKAAIAFARDHGAAVLEVYPWDTDEAKSPSSIYTGVASTFARLGFSEVQRLVPHKPMMRLRIDRP